MTDVTWTNDERGKPCKWIETIVVRDDEMPSGLLPPERLKQVDAAIRRCIEAIEALKASAENYVIRVAPELVVERNLEETYRSYIIRARVRWCASAEIAARWAEFGSHVMAEVDDEMKLCEEERAKHGTVL